MNSLENISVMKGPPHEVIGESFIFNINRAEARVIALVSQGLPITPQDKTAVERHWLIPKPNLTAGKLIQEYNESLTRPSFSPEIRNNLFMLNLASSIVTAREYIELADQRNFRVELVHLAQTGVVEMMTAED